ncbi:MAG: ATP-binding protein, partial [Epsilonproteobacteria bacterium]|nr:ATP-binding protein [Campylobacterota bacterium]
MEILEFFYKNLPSNENFVPRKCTIEDHSYINLFGARGVGKSALVLDYLANLDKKNILYIDIDDPNILFAPIYNLQNFINKEMIETLVLDHYNDKNISLPKVKQLIIVSREPIDDDNFTQIKLTPLDFEEFLAFETSTHTTAGFSHYLKIGSLPKFAASHKAALFETKEFLKSKFSVEEMRLLGFLALFATKQISINQIYTRCKEYFKISKDWLYKTVERLQREGVIHLIEDYRPSASKKLIFYDNAVTKYLNRNLTFIMLFEQAVVLELLKRDEEICSFYNLGYLYTDGVLTILAPFDSEEAVWAKCQKNISKIKQAEIHDAKIITVANSYEYIIDGIRFEAMPFYEWSLV